MGQQQSTLVRDHATHSASRWHGKGGLNAYLAYIMRGGGRPMNILALYSSQTSLVGIRRRGKVENLAGPCVKSEPETLLRSIRDTQHLLRLLHLASRGEYAKD